MTKPSYIEMIEEAIYESQDTPRSCVSRQKIHHYILDVYKVDVINDGARKASFKRALETGCSNGEIIQDKQSFRLSANRHQERSQGVTVKRQPSTSPNSKSVKKETPKKSAATKKTTAAKGGKGTPAPKKKAGGKAVKVAA